MNRVPLDLDLPTRRDLLAWLAATPSLWALGCAPAAEIGKRPSRKESGPGDDAVLAVEPLGSRWPTTDPFLFCAYHYDTYPAANELMGPAAPLAGRHMGRDFAGKDGWNMYHGQVVPGFPRHPHRGFETVTVVKTGLLDHADSLGATARYGEGDVQWLTAGAGIQHAEMFPLLDRDGKNPLELFQIWLNLPSGNKMVDPHFSMLWAPTIPTIELTDDLGQKTQLTIVAGGFGEVRSPAPPPRSYASQPDADVAIWTLAMEPGAAFTLPAGPTGTVRSVYFHRGKQMQVAGRPIDALHRVVVRGDARVSLIAGERGADVLVLSGRPIDEPIARRGPFVMNSEAEIKQAYADYKRTGFGGWPWPRDDYVHGWEGARFARRPDGSVERPA
jgi:redox-sensitive bicupin YhaK (pirin superfamily)